MSGKGNGLGNSAKYQSTGSRDPIWTRVSGDPSIEGFGDRNQASEEKVQLECSTTSIGKGLNVTSAAIFIAGEMAGSGVLALPRAIVDAGWIGIVLLVVFCVNAGYGGSRLGYCWAIIEERYPEYRERVRNPYATIAHRAVGKWGSYLVSGCIQFTLCGAGTVYLQLASQIFQDLMKDILPQIGICVWFIFIAILLTVPMWLGSPKDFWVVGIGALLTTAFACVFIFSQIIIDGLHNTEPVPFKAHGFSSFFLSFGTILFSFGGASTFPTIQNDMAEKQQFSKSILIGFITIMALYFPVAVGGFFVYGELVDPNVILSLGHSSLVTMANVLMAIHLVLAFLIVINPVCQELEEIFQVPHDFCVKRCVLRTIMMCVMVFIGETIPKFGKILSLVGGSTITLLTFVFPSLFYMILCDQKRVDWPERHIPLHMRVYMWELILIGLVGGTASTYNAIQDIFSSESVAKPCYWS